MRRPLVAAAVLACLVGGSTATAGAPVPAGTGAPDASTLSVSVEPCSFSAAWSVRYRRVDGRPTSGTFRVSDRASCSAPQLSLAVRARLLHDGRLVKGFEPGGSCASSPGAWRCSQVAGRGSLRVAKGIAGTWVLRITMTVRGPDAPRAAAYEGCVFTARTLTAKCSVDSRPLRIR